ncbi:MAG: LicD family protein, partial [Lachnospiraceae bacterium]|nr:LicD family protein [Lachnospiraceae bacterium]
MELNFPDNYFEDEVRDGFYVDGMMKRCWASQLVVLSEIDKVCKKLGVRWFADCGTLLGAVRHGGYIPWDDDLDICMLRDDYDKFRTQCKEYLPEGYKILYYDRDPADNEQSWDLLLRIINSDRISYDTKFLEKYHNFPFVSGIDIFPIDYLTEDEEQEEFRRNLGIIIREAAYAPDIASENMSADTRLCVENVEKAFNIKLNPGFRKRQLFGLLENVYSMYGKKGAKHVALMPYWMSEHSHKYDLSWFENIIQIPFEGTHINAPAAYDAVLRTEYGDYIEVCRFGGVHDYPYYSKQYSYMSGSNGKPLYSYEYKESDLLLKGPEASYDLKTSALDFTEVLFEAHDKVISAIVSGNKDQALDILAQAQDGAVRIGTLIEEEYGEGFVTVKYLEGYCETLFEVHSLVMSEGAENQTEIVKDKLDRSLAGVKISIESDLSNKKKEVVFMPYSHKLWPAMEKIWETANADPDTTAYVIPIPYYDRALNGEATALHFEPDKYPSYIKITDFNAYDFGARKPDTIYIQMAHDEYHPTVMTHPFFFSSHLREFTPNLVYIPPFMIDEIEEGDERGKQSLNYFVKKPGVVIADKTLVASQSIRESYIEALCEMAGEDSRGIWEKKIQVDSRLEYQNASLPVEIPEEWKDKILKNNKKKKVILYRTSISDLFEKKEAVIEKMKNVFKIFKDNTEEVCLIWRPDSNVRNVLRQKYPKLWGEYRNILEEIKREDWAIVDESEEFGKALMISD